MYNVKTTRIPNRETPQGGVIYFLLLSPVVDELLQRLIGLGFECEDYADNIVLIIRGKFEGSHCESLQKSLRVIEQVCSTVELNIILNKTTIRLIGKVNFQL